VCLPPIITSSLQEKAGLLQVEGRALLSLGARRIEIPTDDEATYDKRLAQVCLGGERWKTEGPLLVELLAVLDRTQEHLREGGLTETC
jgi:hypothetical protein